MRRYAPLFGVVSVLLLAMIVGLLVGHWVTQSKSPSGPQVFKVEGLGGAGAAAASTTPTTSGAKSASASKAATSSKSEEEKEKAEAKREEKEEETKPAKAPAAKPLSEAAATKQEKSIGKTHEEELNKLDHRADRAVK